VKLHAVVSDLEAARAAVEGGATVVQLRVKAPTEQVVEVGRGFRELPATFVVNDDVDAALQLGADGAHLGRDDPGAQCALAAGLLLGTSAATAAEARKGEALGAGYIGAGPVWATPTKPDADPPIGLEGLAEISRAVALPVIAIGGVDASNAGDCIRAGAAGVAVVRAAEHAGAVLAAVDAAL
jgi:thiamine-phosphate pyrophosphorylase